MRECILFLALCASACSSGNDLTGCVDRSTRMFTVWATGPDGKVKDAAIPTRADAERFCQSGWFDRGMMGMTAAGGAPPWVAGTAPPSRQDSRWFGGPINLPEERRDPCAPGACYNVTGRGEAGSGDGWRQATRTECVNCGEGRTIVIDRQGRQTHAEDMRRDIETGDLWWRSARPVPAQGSTTQRAVDRAGDRLQRELMLFDARRPR